MLVQQTKETLAMMMIGDGLLTVINPDRHALLWKTGPKFWRDSMETMAQRPTLARFLGAAELGLGLWLARKQKPH